MKMRLLEFLLIILLSMPGLTGQAAGKETKTLTNSIGLEMVFIPAGSIMIGSGLYRNESPFHRVTNCQPFFLGKYEVTRKQWLAVMGKTPGKYRSRPNPEEKKSLDGVQVFIKKVNEIERVTGYRLPTEMEWEYAIQAGKIHFANGLETDPKAPSGGSLLVNSDGDRQPSDCWKRRISVAPARRSSSMGFRLAFDPGQHEQ